MATSTSIGPNRRCKRIVQELDRHEGQHKQITLEFDEEERRQLRRTCGTGACASSSFDRDLAGDLIGAVRSGRSDLATNKRLLDEAVVQDSHLAGSDGGR